jgi:tRNA threonylcarbamoyl adenosine modification protein (Sua5/YciO/YrdC/YwlC family)
MNHDASIAGQIDDPRTRDLAYETLARGGVVVLPTDTLPGLSARISAEDAVRRIGAIKRAPNERRYILLASALEMVDRYVRSYGCVARAVLAARWPAPFSVILPAGAACPPWVGPTVAVRVPALAPLRALIERLGEPIVSTSVNRTGQEALEDAHAIRREFGHEVDLIVTGGAQGPAASTVVDLSGETPVIVRRGDYAWAATDGAGKPSK